MSGQRAAGNELSMAQTITALRNENTVLKDQLLFSKLKMSSSFFDADIVPENQCLLSMDINSI